VSVFEQLQRELLSWPGVTSGPHRFGGTEFRVDGREMGHLHGSSLADLPFPMDVRNKLVSDGTAEPHHIMPQSGWVSFYIKEGTDADIKALLGLFKMQYERLMRKKAT
jgi:hypothetical protein